MREYRTAILIGVIYLIALATIPFIRIFSVITVMFFALEFLFHGAFVIAGRRAVAVHQRFVETHLATLTAFCLYALSAGIYFTTLKGIIK
ncbi:MAG: hypothetical protein GX206_07855 [Clostridiales bacterium]|nr:hypothetical protein [Clostridiales bacterium]